MVKRELITLMRLLGLLMHLLKMTDLVPYFKCPLVLRMDLTPKGSIRILIAWKRVVEAEVECIIL